MKKAKAVLAHWCVTRPARGTTSSTALTGYTAATCKAATSDATKNTTSKKFFAVDCRFPSILDRRSRAEVSARERALCLSVSQTRGRLRSPQYYAHDTHVHVCWNGPTLPGGCVAP